MHVRKAFFAQAAHELEMEPSREIKIELYVRALQLLISTLTTALNSESTTFSKFQQQVRINSGSVAHHSRVICLFIVLEESDTVEVMTRRVEALV